MNKLLSRVLATTAAVVLPAAAANAATYVSYFDWSNTGTNGAVVQLPGVIDESNAWGKATIVEGTDMLTVTIELYGLAGFINTGNGQTSKNNPGAPGNKQPFSFNADGAYTVAPSNSNDPNPSDANDQTFFYYGHSASTPYENNPFGYFTDSIGCCYAPGNIQNGSVAGSPGPLVFTISAPGMDISHVFSNGGTSGIDGGNAGPDGGGGWWFAADVTTSFNGGSTFTIAARDINCVSGCDVTTTVPEPAIWSLMILGFGGAGAMLRTRRSRLRAI